LVVEGGVNATVCAVAVIELENCGTRDGLRPERNRMRGDTKERCGLLGRHNRSRWSCDSGGGEKHFWMRRS